jgi:hypothetical protein
MNILKGIKNLFNKSRNTKKDFRLEFCTLVIDRINFKINDAKEKPDDLSNDEWKIILNKILFAVANKKAPIMLKSLGKTKIKQKKITEGFRLLEVYFNNL